jgi:hypothetical protein
MEGVHDDPVTPTLRYNVVGAPGPDRENVVLAEVRPVDAAVSVYVEPTVPPKVQLVTLTIPAVATRFVQFDNVPPFVARVITALDVVTGLPAESSIPTVGIVANAEPAAPPTGCVAKTSCVAGPGELGEKPLLVAVRVRAPTVTDALR